MRKISVLFSLLFTANSWANNSCPDLSGHYMNCTTGDAFSDQRIYNTFKRISIKYDKANQKYLFYNIDRHINFNSFESISFQEGETHYSAASDTHIPGVTRKKASEYSCFNDTLVESTFNIYIVDEVDYDYSQGEREEIDRMKRSGAVPRKMIFSLEEDRLIYGLTLSNGETPHDALDVIFCEREK